ncbi:MAG: hypothetical protein HY820_14685 [Acidobacteria bacterium]|nr:hypothetical protein [Acidobacteriota bacterium]
MNDALDQWKREIERLSSGPVVIVPVETDAVRNVLNIPPVFAGRAVMVQLLSAEAFVSQLVRAHALNVNVDGPLGVFHFVILNRRRAADWEGMEDSLIAHEFGHIWLNVTGYRSLEAGTDARQACLATHASDVIQHILIREEAQRRGLDTMRFWLRVHTAALVNERTPAATTGRCEQWQAFAEWMDAMLGAPRWDLLDKYERSMTARYPALRALVTSTRDWLATIDLWDRSVYEHALHRLTSDMLTIR